MVISEYGRRVADVWHLLSMRARIFKGRRRGSGSPTQRKRISRALCILCFPAWPVTAMVKRKNKVEAEMASAPSQKHQKHEKHEKPSAPVSECKEKGDTHKWAYATNAYFGKTPFNDKMELDPLLQEVGAHHANMHANLVWVYDACAGYSLASKAKRRRDHRTTGGHDLQNRRSRRGDPSLRGSGRMVQRMRREGKGSRGIGKRFIVFRITLQWGSCRPGVCRDFP